MMIPVSEITEMQQKTVALWHSEAYANPYRELLQLSCQQHRFNYELWHQEDIARAVDVSDSRIAEVKRAIDKLNQNRNDWIEKIDDWIHESLTANQVQAPHDAPFNTETPGSVIDRLSILSLRIYHLYEQTERTDASEEHIASVERKLAICHVQQDDLAASLQQLLDDIGAGLKRHKTYRQFKMYNDPTLNPYLYKIHQKKAG